MAMYADLLRHALDESDAGHEPGELLLAELVEAREALQRPSGQGGSAPSAPDVLAREIAYDVALIRFCVQLGVPASPEGFGHPPRERARLEQVLAARGVLLAEAQPAVTVV